MKRLLFVSFGTSFLLIALVGLFLGIGYYQDSKFIGTKSEWIGADPEDIWAYLTDIEDVVNRRSEVSSVEILERFPNKTPKKWKEIPDLGGFMIFEVVTSERPKIWKISLTDSSFKLRGTWTYELSKKEPGTVFTVTEESEITSIPVRGAYYLSGRDATLQKEIDLIRNRFSGR